MIDLHTYTTASDGQLTPQELVAYAVTVGVDVLAITDRDTTAGAAAAAAVVPAGLTLVPGVEISCREADGGRVHLLAYLFDPGNRMLAETLGRIRDSREMQARRAVGLLRADGHPIDWPQVAMVAGGSRVGPRHVAAAMVTAGLAPTLEIALGADWLGLGGPLHTPAWRPTVARAITVVRGAGGVPVLAHPRAPGSAPFTTEHVAEMAAHGLGGIEVNHPGHDDEARRELRELAATLGVLPIGGSGFQGPHTGRLGAASTSRAAYKELAALGGAALIRR
jgi:predicted metal-dependent phosphoesterase TrpH